MQDSPEDSRERVPCPRDPQATQDLVAAVKHGDLVLVRDALDRGGEPLVCVTTPIGGWWCLVSEAAWRCHAHLLAYLLAAGLTPEGRGTDHRTPLMLAVWQSHQITVDALLALGANPQARDRTGRTALHHAAERGHVGCVEALAGVTARPPRGEAATTALHWASRGGHLAVVKVLLAAGWPITTRDWRGWTPLHWAAVGGSVEVLWFLVEAGLDPLEQSCAGHTPLDLARLYGHHYAVPQEWPRLLVDVDSVRQHRLSDEDNHRHIVSCMKAGLYAPHWLAIVPDHAMDGDGLTLLHRSAQCRSARDWVLVLMERGASTHVMTPDGMTPGDLARRAGHMEVLEALRGHQCCKGDSPPDKLYRELLATISRGDDAGKVSTLLCQGSPLQAVGSGTDLDLECGSVQALRLAVLSDRSNTVRLLLASGAKLPASLLQEAWQSRDVSEHVLADLTTAYCCRLHAERRRAEHSTKLVKGIDHLLEAIEGAAPWDAAWPRNSLQELSRLMAEAARCNCPLTAGFLSLAGAWPFLSEERGASALHEALRAGNSSMAEVLVKDLGACIYISDADGDLPRDLLPEAELRRLEQWLFLKEQSKLQDLEIVQDVGHRQATARQALAVQKELFQCYVAGRPHAGLSPAADRIPLLLAARLGLPQLIYLMVQVGRLSVDAVIDEACGTTALHEAASHGRGVCVSLLLCHGAERQVRDKYGQTPSLLAAMFGHRNICDLLDQLAPRGLLACRAGTTSQQVRKNFDAYLQRSGKCGRHIQESLSLTNCRHPETFTHKLLQGISLPQLQQEAQWASVDFSGGEAREVTKAVMAELQAILNKVSSADDMYRGELILAGSSRDGSKLYAPDEFDVNLVIKKDNITMCVEKTERLLAPRKGRNKLSVTGDNPGLEGNKFVTMFFSLVQETLAEHQLLHQKLSLVPPGLTSTQVGVALALAWQGKEYPLLLVRVDLVPVLEVQWHQEVARPQLTPQNISGMHLSNTTGGSWRCSFALVEAEVLGQLSPAERLTYLMGKTLLFCHMAEQWTPRLRTDIRNTWRHWKSRVSNGFSYKNAFLRWLEQQRWDEQQQRAGQEDDPGEGLVEIFMQMCVNPTAARRDLEAMNIPALTAERGDLQTMDSPAPTAARDLQARDSPAYFGGDCEAPKSGKGAPLILQWLEEALKKRTQGTRLEDTNEKCQ